MRKLTLIPMWLAASCAWTWLAYSLFVLDIGAVPDPLAPVRLLYYGLLLAAPALTFYPVARMIDARLLTPEATVCWAGLLFLLSFVSPDAAGLPGYLLFLVFYFGAVSSIFLPLGYAVGFRFLTLRAHRRDTGRARREAYLAGLFVVLSTAMNMAGFYNTLNALLLLLILALVESFALAHKPGVALE